MSKEIDTFIEWEYRIEFDSPLLPSNRTTHKERFDDMGSEGWELVSFVVADSTLAFAIYKRPKH